MNKVPRKWDLLTKERKEQLLKEIITFFKTEREQDIGVIAAEDVLDFFLDALGPEIYNKAIADSKATVRQGFENLDVDLDLLINT